MKLKELAGHFTSRLHQVAEEEEAKLFFQLAIAHISGYGKAEYLLHQDHIVTTEVAQQVEEILNRLLQHEPIQHILGETYFYGLKLKVNGSVLIPRPETEELVDWILQKTAHQEIRMPDAGQLTLLDIGTGSGCIAIALRKHLSDSKVYAIDISPEALAVAAENARLNEVPIELIELDILQSDADKLPAPIAVIVSNPPYITPAEQKEMHPNVLQYEPHSALFVPQNDPLLFYRAIADAGLEILVEEGWLFLEINEYLGKATIDLLDLKGFKNIELKKDLNGKDRMICCQK